MWMSSGAFMWTDGPSGIKLAGTQRQGNAAWNSWWFWFLQHPEGLCAREPERISDVFFMCRSVSLTAWWHPSSTSSPAVSRADQLLPSAVSAGWSGLGHVQLPRRSVLHTGTPLSLHLATPSPFITCTTKVQGTVQLPFNTMQGF